MSDSCSETWIVEADSGEEGVAASQAPTSTLMSLAIVRMTACL